MSVKIEPKQSCNQIIVFEALRHLDLLSVLPPTCMLQHVWIMKCGKSALLLLFPTCDEWEK